MESSKDKLSCYTDDIIIVKKKPCLLLVVLSVIVSFTVIYSSIIAVYWLFREYYLFTGAILP